jgi:hypothetical protein
MNFVMFLYVVVLAFLLSPGILVSLPPGGSRKTVALTHAVVLALVYAITHKLVFKNFASM